MIRALRCSLGALVVAAVVIAPRPVAASPLQLDEVLVSVERHHPLRASVVATVERAAGQLLAAEGAYDPEVRARGQATPIGYYQPLSLDAEVRALTPLRGLTPFVGWRLNRGELPVYDWKQRTLDGGELRAGLELPLLRDAGIDRPRSELAKAKIAGAIATAEVRQRELDLQEAAARAYWDWVAAGHRLQVRETQLALARDRDAGIRQAIISGNTAPIEQVDNARVIASREAQVVAARRDVIRAGLGLSLHLRAGNGNPIVPGLDRLPALATVVAPARLEMDLEGAVARALELSPAVAALRLRRDVTSVELELARNARLPSLTVSAYAVHDLGARDPEIPDRGQPELGVGVVFELPVGMRAARGAAQVAEADRRRLGLEARYLREQLAIEVRTAHAELVAARARADLAQAQAALAEQLAAAERTRFARGDSTILVVNLREDAAVDARVSEIDSRAEVHRSQARFVTLLGDSLR